MQIPHYYGDPVITDTPAAIKDTPLLQTPRYRDTRRLLRTPYHCEHPPKRGIISLIPKKDKEKKYLKNWRPIFLLNNDYKIVTMALALLLEKVLPTIISPNQTGYVKGRYIGESITIITGIMSFTKKKNIPGLAVFLDFEKAFDSIEWCYL